MKLSVLVTCYNQKEYIVEAIESILSQKVNFAYEIIIGDDESSDGSYELIKKKYSDYDNIKTFQLSRQDDGERNASIRASKLRVRLLESVRGEYFAYLDGDDFYCDNLKFQRQIDILDDPSNSDCVCCADDSYFYYDKDNIRKIAPEYLVSGKIPLKEYWYSLWFHASNCVFRSSIINTMPHQLLDKVFHDNIITFWALQSGSLYYQNVTTMCYRQAATNSIWTVNKEIVRHIRQIIGYDVCVKLNPKFWFCMYYRNRMSFEYLCVNRNKNFEDISSYVNLAKELNCKDTLSLVLFREQNLLKKVTIRIKHTLLSKICYLKAIKINRYNSKRIKKLL